MTEIVCIDEFREGPCKHSPALCYEIRVADKWIPWQGLARPKLLDDAVIHTDSNGWRYATAAPEAPVDDDDQTYVSLEVAAPPRIAEYRVVAMDNIGDLELMVNQLIGYNYSWQPYGAPLTMHGFWYQAMVRFDGKAADAARATSSTGVPA